MFIPRAATVLKAGHLPKKRVIPRVETTAEPIASGLHKSPGTKVPQNDNAAATKPSRDTIPGIAAIVVTADDGREGNSHDRAGSQPPVFVLGPCAIEMSAPKDPT